MKLEGESVRRALHRIGNGVAEVARALLALGFSAAIPAFFCASSPFRIQHPFLVEITTPLSDNEH